MVLSTFKKNNGFYYNYEKQREVISEIDNLTEKYGMNREIFDHLAKRVCYNKLNVNEITEVVDLIARILKCNGYSDEDITNYFNINKKLLDVKSSVDFRLRVYILSHFGFLEEAILDGYYYFLQEYINDFSINQLYAILCEYGKGSLKGLDGIIKNLSKKERIILTRKYILNNDLLKKFSREFLIHLFENKNQLSKKLSM